MKAASASASMTGATAIKSSLLVIVVLGKNLA
jgi:hypothetical protein